MAITVQIDGDAITSSDTTVITLPDRLREDAIQSTTLDITTTASDTIILSIAGNVNNWGRNLVVNNSFPITYPTPDTVNLLIEFPGTRGPDGPAFIGCGWQRFVITYTEGGGAEQTFIFQPRGRLGSLDGALDATPLEMTFDEFRNFWISSFYSISAATRTEENPFGFGWSVDSGGHRAFYDNHATVDLDNGFNQIFVHTPFGYNGAGDFQLDQRLEIEESSVGISLWWDSWEEIMEEMQVDYPNSKMFVYLGSPRQDSQFLASINSSDAKGFIERFMKSVEPVIKYSHGQLNVDVPYTREENVTSTNALSEPGEPRFEAMDMLRKLMALQGKQFHIEPRGAPHQTWWDADQGWDRVMTAQSYYRSNPDWYNSSSVTNRTNEDSGEIIVINSGDVTPEFYPHRTADVIYHGDRVTSSFRYWILAGNTLEDLYDEVMDHLRFFSTGGQS